MTIGSCSSPPAGARSYVLRVLLRVLVCVLLRVLVCVLMRVLVCVLMRVLVCVLLRVLVRLLMLMLVLVRVLMHVLMRVQWCSCSPAALAWPSRCRRTGQPAKPGRWRPRRAGSCHSRCAGDLKEGGVEGRGEDERERGRERVGEESGVKSRDEGWEQFFEWSTHAQPWTRKGSDERLSG